MKPEDVAESYHMFQEENCDEWVWTRATTKQVGNFNFIDTDPREGTQTRYLLEGESIYEIPLGKDVIVR